MIAQIAARQYGVVTVAQMHAAGLSDSAIGRRVRAGRLHRVGQGVYAVGHAALAQQGRWLAEVLVAGEGAALTGLACAKHYEIWRYRVSLIDVVVPARRRPKTTARIHRCDTLDPRDVTGFKGIPVTTIPRLLVDLTGELTKWELANVMHEAEFKDLLRLDHVRDARERAGRRNHITRLDDAIALHERGSAGIRSRGEGRFLNALEQAGLEEPLVNTHLNGYEVDFHWPDLALAIELDGPHHRRTRTRHEDARKEAAWRAGGFEVLRFREGELEAATRAVAAHRTTGSWC
ncbi:type IV toxin-antitoxin system AbiEi family antitoxin domain-containing protein [Solirubrobacter sp. CPCC 204708]|uniref:Type IV toxin-antitoxin system AbiEi family antitoxin domain-containing protein n=1 Tax=Solirubrobacter deserti TaxID=2282478 RepID=A0ABT4RGB3_9ACTN|nr:type IV toxin-antitoxin system AbiEi family antitoxin domain-containing protein [Solirubrobacter deserti]MBE2319665.1 type IV toxin-antitoxin system AbiEi family antitoxin domain-containing protein [Solirubrobacter deserti]MDA0137596.1 type IV toxin-antitoxin system AbiEi family antitoxin domain-containing protein [Solirubrobacter deserti]